MPPPPNPTPQLLPSSLSSTTAHMLIESAVNVAALLICSCTCLNISMRLTTADRPPSPVPCARILTSGDSWPRVTTLPVLSSVADFAMCLSKGTLGQSICMGCVLSEPSELTGELYGREHCVSVALLPHKSLLFIYFSFPGEMLLQREQRFLLYHGRFIVCVCVLFCACVCALKPSSERVKNSCGERMLLLPLGLRELQTDRREEPIEGFQCEHVRACVLKRKRLANFPFQ